MSWMDNDWLLRGAAEDTKGVQIPTLNVGVSAPLPMVYHEFNSRCFLDPSLALSL